MSKSSQLYRDYKTKFAAWEKLFDAEPNAPKKVRQEMFFGSPKYRAWEEKERAANRKVSAAHKKLYNHLKKLGLKMSPYSFNRLLDDSVSESEHGKIAHYKAKATMKILLATMGKNELKANIKSKYKLPTQSQLLKGCRRK